MEIKDLHPEVVAKLTDLTKEQKILSGLVVQQVFAERKINKIKADICEWLTGIRQGFIIKKGGLLYRVERPSIENFVDKEIGCNIVEPIVWAIRVTKQLQVIKSKLPGGGYDDKIYIDSRVEILGFAGDEGSEAWKLANPKK